MSDKHFTIIPLLVSVDVLSLNLKSGSIIYLVVSESNGYSLVRWHISAWQCSCGKRGCQHILAVNGWILANPQPRKPTKSIGYPADWPKPRYHYGQTVYRSQEPLIVVGMRLERYFSFLNDEDIQEWVYLARDRDDEEVEVGEPEIGLEPVKADQEEDGIDLLFDPKLEGA